MSDDKSGREFALEIVRRLQEGGYQALWAGGCVRDLILGQFPADYDVATSATPAQVMAVLPFRAVTVGIAFGVVRVRHPRRPGVEVEVATFRSDGAYIDGRRPESVVFSSPELDAARRDFTINGMFLDPVTDTLIDYVGGRADLENRILRAIGEPEARFREDKLRILRAVRFSARFQFAIEPATLTAIQMMASQVVGVSRERIAQELRKMLVHKNRADAMQMTLDTGLAASVIPDLLPMKGMFPGSATQAGQDLWDHVMGVLRHLPTNPSFTLALAALLHDIGKPSTRVFCDGHYQFPKHEEVGARISERSCLDLKLSNAERERITWLVAFHQSLVEAKTLPDSKLKRILAEPGIEDLLTLHRAIALASTGNTDHVDYCLYYRQAQPAGAINPPPLITGHDLVQLGLTPGAQFAAILNLVREAQLDGQLKTKQEALAWVERRQ